MPFQSIVDVHMILRRADGRVLLAERKGGYAAGMLNVPGGKLEAREDAISAAVRETLEEINVKVDPADVRPVSVIHHCNPAGETRVGFFFETTEWAGEPVNVEPDKCGGLVWVDPRDLPDNTIAYTAAGLEAAVKGEMFRLHGWQPDERLVTIG